MEQLINKIAGFERELDNNRAVTKEKFNLVKQPAEVSLINVQRDLARIETTVLDFYSIVNGLEIKWKANEAALAKLDIAGSIVVNPFSQVVKDWSGVVYFNNEPKDSARRKFFPLDFFADEAAAGFCTMEGWRNMIYLYQFEGDLIPLHVNFQSYLELMLKAKGCLYWQYLIREIEEKEENEVSKRIKQHLPSLFPDFSFESFRQTFDVLRLK